MEIVSHRDDGESPLPRKVPMSRDARVIFHPLNIVATVRKGTNLLDAIRDAGIWCESICGGKGECGKCRVIIKKGVYSPKQGSRKHISEKDIRDGYVLACEVRVEGDMEITIPLESRIKKPKILSDSLFPREEFSPAVRRYQVDRSTADLYPFPGGSLVLTGYAGSRPRIAGQLYGEIQSCKSPVSVLVTLSPGYPEVIRVDPGTDTPAYYGLALDVGTTTLAAALVDLTTGDVMATGSGLNRQITYGEELITRISYAREPAGRKNLQEAVVESINAVIKDLAARCRIATADIVEACVGSNTVMNYLLLGRDPSDLELVGTRVNRKPSPVRAELLGLDMLPGGCVWCIPSVSRFLGGDVIGDLIAARVHEQPGLSLVIDLGTNGEVVFGNQDWFSSASCAAGPAFEGAGISSGMRAMEGAIDHVTIDRKTLKACYTVLGKGRPRGICGSGIIDATLAMFQAGLMDFAGKLVEGRPFIRAGPEGLEYPLAEGGDTAHGRDIVITQKDLDYFMDSKAALCGGIAVLMKKHHIGVGDVKHVYLAGAFGAFTDMENAVNLGILPRFPRAEFHMIGNGSLAGAYATLTSVAARRVAEKLAAMMDYIDLLTDTDFIEEYTAALYIPGKQELFPKKLNDDTHG
jgi:uncharacterized 2Fe-2S/4Fe-4S cluster protein (DUF4445 family)